MFIHVNGWNPTRDGSVLLVPGRCVDKALLLTLPVSDCTDLEPSHPTTNNRNDEAYNLSTTNPKLSR